MSAVDPENLRPVFVCGVSRSGTSLLTQLLDGHPQVLALPDESLYLRYSSRLKGLRHDAEQYMLQVIGHAYDVERGVKLKPGIVLDRGRTWRPTALWKGISELSPDIEADEKGLLRVIESGATERKIFLHLVALYLMRVASGSDESRFTTVVEKTPGNEFIYPWLRELFPKAKFIHMVRDPFDNLRSRVARKGEITWKKVEWPGLVNMVFQWRRSHRVGAAAVGTAQDHYRLLRYEDLVSRPVAVLEALCEFLDIEYSEGLLKPTAGGGKVALTGGSHEAGDDLEVSAIRSEGLARDAAAVLGDRHMLGIASCLGLDYHAVGYHKYDKWLDRGSARYRLNKYEHEKAFQWFLRQGLSIGFGAAGLFGSKQIPETAFLGSRTTTP